LVAACGIKLIIALSPEGLTRVAETRLDLRVLAFTAVVSLATGIAFGLAPALTTFRTDLVQSLKEGARGATGGVRGNRLSNLLVVGEVAFALVLLVGAGLLVQTLMRLQQVELGFDARNVLTFNVTRPADATSGPPQIAAFYQELTARLKALPGVVNASVVFQPPLGGSASSTGLSIEGKPESTASQTVATFHSVGPEYFRTMGIRLVKGREFTDRDNLNSAPVLIINESLAHTCFPNEDPVGKRIAPGFSSVPMKAGAGMREIVGIVTDVKHQNLQSSGQPEIYFAQAQMPMAATSVVVRTSSDPHSLISAVRHTVQTLERNAPVYSVRTVEELLSRSVAGPRFNSVLIALFAGAALILTAVGLYGVVSRSVTQSTYEIGIRVALGARPTDVLKNVMGRGMALVLAGVGVGLIGALLLTRVMESLLFGVTPTDPLTFAGIALLLLGTAFLATVIPARRATKVDPIVALRIS
jgi:putative ABC transport system permease protein